MEITKEDIMWALDEGLAEIVEADNGVMCAIWDNSFYFCEYEAYGVSLEEFLDCYTKEEIANMIVDTIGTPELAEESGIDNGEWVVYYLYLLESKRYKLKAKMESKRKELENIGCALAKVESAMDMAYSMQYADKDALAYDLKEARKEGCL